MNYIIANWSFDPFAVVAVILVIWHEIGLARLARRSRPERTRQRRLRSLWFYSGLLVLLIAVESPVMRDSPLSTAGRFEPSVAQPSRLATIVDSIPGSRLSRSCSSGCVAVVIADSRDTTVAIDPVEFTSSSRCTLSPAITERIWTSVVWS